MTARASSIAGRLAGGLSAATLPVTVLTGPCGCGRTEVLLQLRRLLGPGNCQYVNVERVATTPERFLRSLVNDSPFQGAPQPSASSVLPPRDAFDTCLAFLTSACTHDGQPATFLLDEVLDLRTFESFPGLRSAVPDLIGALESSPNRFVLATRFSHRASRLAEAHKSRLAVVTLPPMTVSDIQGALAHGRRDTPDGAHEDMARSVFALTDGRPAYVGDLLDAVASMTRSAAAADPVGAFVGLLTSPSTLGSRCRFSYELRLHRARGYGALKAILDVLADEEPLTLTAISQRLSRTPGSTKDYLSWLEDVDLVAVERKRYRISDPVLRLWIRVNGRSAPATDDFIAREVQRYAMIRLAAVARAESTAAAEKATAALPTPQPEVVGARGRSSGIVEFD